jgi:hypothetical protein
MLFLSWCSSLVSSRSKENMARLLMSLGVVISITFLLAQFSPAFAETRVALVIGNEAYQDVPRLRNPANDANAVAAALKRSGFDTILAVNLDQRGMEDAAIRFSRAARTADIALFYYSGHALQFNGVNYLAPVDTSLRDESDLRRMTRVDQIVEDLQQAKNLRILVLDSCRDNPFAEQLRRSIGDTRALPMGRGLARFDAPQGMIMVYATQAGRTAADGMGNNSPYTAAFLKHIEKQEEIGSIFREISEDVYETTKHTQLPELSLSIIGRFYLRGKGSEDAGPSTSPAPPSVVDRSKSDFETAMTVDTVAGWEAFLRQYPEGFYADLARDRKARIIQKEIEKNKLAALKPPSAAQLQGRKNDQASSPIAEKLNAYIGCMNRLSERSYQSRSRYFSWAAKSGPTGKERIIYGTYTIYDTSDCKKNVEAANELEPHDAELEVAAMAYVTAVTKLEPLLIEADDYYTQENYKDDKMAKGKALHPRLVAAWDEFAGADQKLKRDVEAIDDRRAWQRLAAIEKSEGRTARYNVQALMIEAKRLLRAESAETPDVALITLALDDYESKVKAAEQFAGNDTMGSTFIDNAKSYLATAKQLMRRIRDKVPYNTGERMILNSGGGGWMIEGSPARLARDYNQLVDSYNSGANH